MVALEPRDVPSHLLRAAYLLGKFPFRACHTDQRVSYTAYIPEQYRQVHEALHQKASNPRLLPLLVNVHSTRRDASLCRDSLIEFADAHGVAILAPLFPAGLDSISDLDSYKTLRSKTIQSDLVLLAILDEVSRFWPGIETHKVSLCGFSGGAQFALRFAYIWPERITALAIASPGRTTEISTEAWPRGTSNVQELFQGRTVDVAALREIADVRLFVGGNDDQAAQKETVELQAWIAAHNGWSNTTPKDPSDRLELIQKLHQNWQESGIACQLEIVPGVGHDYRGIIPAVIRWLSGCRSLTSPAS